MRVILAPEVSGVPAPGVCATTRPGRGSPDFTRRVVTLTGTQPAAETMRVRAAGRVDLAFGTGAPIVLGWSQADRGRYLCRLPPRWRRVAMTLAYVSRLCKLPNMATRRKSSHSSQGKRRAPRPLASFPLDRRLAVQSATAQVRSIRRYRFVIEGTQSHRAGRKADGPDLWCSFCGKHRRDVEHLINGPRVAICSECIELCSEILSEQRGETVSPAEPDAPFPP